MRKSGRRRSTVAWLATGALSVFSAFVFAVPASAAADRPVVADESVPDATPHAAESVRVAAGPRPLFQLPFPCGQTWALFSYGSHAPADKKIDMQRVNGPTGGSPVVATYGGVVHSFGDPGGIEINHGGGWFSLYLHMPTRTVSVGQRVVQGQQIGTVGRVGTHVDHLHYELRFDSNGDGDSTNSEIVYSWFDGVQYNMGANGERAYNVTSRNCGAGPRGSIAVGDLNNDGTQDLTGLKANGDVFFTPNLGGGNGITWGAGWLVVGGSDFDQIAVADANGDGRQDLIGRKANGDIYFSPNLGGGNGITWGNGWVIASGSNYTTFDMGDLNNDGRQDLVGRRPNGDVFFTPNLGGGNGITWGTGWLIAGGSDFDQIRVADFNGDGRQDLTGRRANGDIYFTPNLGGGNGITWGTGWLIAGGSTYTTFDVADFNNDGTRDLTGRKPNGDIYFTPNLGGGNGITWGTGWLIAGGSPY